MQHSRALKYLFFAAKLAVAGLSIYWVLHHINIQELIQTSKQLDPFYMMLAMIFMNVAFYFSATRIHFYLTNDGGLIDKPSAIAITYIGLFFNHFLPGGIGGDGYKVWMASRRLMIPWKRALQLVLSDRASGLWWLCIFLGVGALVPFSGNLLPWWSGILWIMVTCLGYLFGLKYILHETKKTALMASRHSFFVQLSTLVVAFALFSAIPDFSQEGGSLLVWFMLFLVSNIVACIPISVGGVGLRELTFLYGGVWWGVDVQIGVTFALMFYAVNVLTALGGIYFLFAPQYRFSEKGSS